MELGERKRKILQAIVDDYVDSAEPVGSRTIAKNHNLGFSSATIRNDMADLEEMGYLIQPHTSSGRIPSHLGYRLYVDQLMKQYELTVAEAQNINEAMELRLKELNQIIRQVSKIISQLTNYTTVVSTPQLNKNSVKHIQLVPIDEFNTLIVLITNEGVVKNQTIKTRMPVNVQFLNKLSNILNEKLIGLTIEEINLKKVNEINNKMSSIEEIRSNEEMLLPILEHIIDSISSIDNVEVYLGGTTNIFNYPEYNDIEKAKEFFNFLEQRDGLYQLVNNMRLDFSQQKDINIVIGCENEFSEMKDCSIISSMYSIGGGNKMVGLIGIIGPTRMEYARMISSLKFLTKKFNDNLFDWFYKGY